MLAINEILQDRYRIIRQLGHGGMGAVYEARDERLGSSVALKEIIVELNKIPTENQRELFLRAFEREAKLLANLHHEAFPRVMDYFSEENRQFLIMELVHGDDLGAQLDKIKKPFPLEDTLKWIDQLLDALDYLHTQSSPIYHRDIKPQNLKVNLRGKIKLLDFGIAKSVDNGDSTMTNQTFVGATLNYAPIEQILPAITATFREFIILKHNDRAQIVLNQNTNAQCDIYAVGATFYHLLTDKTPVDAAKRSLEIWEGNADPLPNPSELNAEIPPSISAFLLKAMEIERENRFSTALEMQEALQTAISSEKNRQKTEEEKRRRSNQEITLPLIETRQLPVTQEQKPADRELTGVNTERLIPKREIMPGTEKEAVEHTQASPTQSANTQPSNVEATPINPSITEAHPTEAFSTQPSGSVSKPELTGTPYFDKNPVAEPKREFASVPPVVNPASRTTPSAKPLWFIPIAAVIVLIAGSVGGFVWLNGSNTPAEIKTTASQTASNSTTTRAATASPTASASPGSAATPNETPKITAAPTQTKPVVQSTFKPTPQPQKTKTPGKSSLSDDCVYNGRNCPKN